MLSGPQRRLFWLWRRCGLPLGADRETLGMSYVETGDVDLSHGM